MPRGKVSPAWVGRAVVAVGEARDIMCTFSEEAVVGTRVVVRARRVVRLVANQHFCTLIMDNELSPES